MDVTKEADQLADEVEQLVAEARVAARRQALGATSPSRPLGSIAASSISGISRLRKSRMKLSNGFIG
jgi:hypothetical protein